VAVGVAVAGVVAVVEEVVDAVEDHAVAAAAHGPVTPWAVARKTRRSNLNSL
jgi:hypothetical protein